MQFKLLILLILSLMVVYSAKASPQLDQLINPKNGKHSGIIRIEDQSDLSNCTAFVINDRAAVTATHCLGNKKIVNPLQSPAVPQTTPAPDTFQVYNSKGENTYITVTAGEPMSNTDIVLVKGDFTLFNKISVDVDNFNIKPGESLYACGYAGSFSTPACNTGEFTGTSTFMGMMNNYLAQGMSGGPVFNKNYKVIGVNSSRRVDGTSMFAILFGHIRTAK